VPSRNGQIHVQDILNSVNSIQRCTANMSFEEFEQNETVNVPHVQLQYPQFPWQLMSNMQNVIAHEYFQINLRIFWNTV
jgi:uncharacterized protein with HEPN domain